MAQDAFQRRRIEEEEAKRVDLQREATAAEREERLPIAERKGAAERALGDARRRENAAETALADEVRALEHSERLIGEKMVHLSALSYAVRTLGTTAAKKTEADALQDLEELEKNAACIRRALPRFEADARECAVAARGAAAAAARADEALDEVDRALRLKIARRRLEARL